MTQDDAKEPTAAAPAPGQEPGLTQVENTGLGAAALRALDFEMSEKPLLSDPLARHLAGAANLDRMRGYIVKLQKQEADRRAREQQGDTAAPVLHENIYFAARGFLLDLDMQRQLIVLRDRFPDADHIQVVSLGAGMCTRPWRMPMPPGIVWFDVDSEGVIEYKKKLLMESKAQIIGAKQQAAPDQHQHHEHVLLCDAYHLVSQQLDTDEQGKSTLRPALTKPGSVFDPTLPTLWCLEGLTYYLDVATLGTVLSDMASLSPPGSIATITVISKDNLDVWEERFHSLYPPGTTPPAGVMRFYTCMDDFVTGGRLTPDSPSLLADMGWKVDKISPDYSEHLPKVKPGHVTLPAYPNDHFGDKHDFKYIPVECTVTCTRK